MRFVFAIVAFVIAAVMIAGGIAQRTVFAPPDRLSLSTTIKGDAAFVVIDGTTLTAHPDRQTLSLSGADTIFLAYGRTSDVKAWLGDEQYAAVKIDTSEDKKAEESLTTQVVTEKQDEPPAVEEPPSETGSPESTAEPAPDEAEAEAAAGDSKVGTADGAASVPGPNPVGSDLWLEEFTAKNALIQPLNIPEDMSVIIASDGTQPAPENLRISWPLNNSAPWVGPLLVAGGLMALIGLALYLWAWRHMKRSRGPRRSGPKTPKGPKMPKLPRVPQYKSKPKALPSSTRGRRSITKSLAALIPLTLASVLVLTGCSAEYWPDLKTIATPVPTPTPTDAPVAEIVPPVVTVPQLERILSRVSEVARDADAERDAELAAKRFTGSALELRKANYKIRGKVKDYPPLPAIPAAPLTLSLPQATESWPRVVMTVVQDKSDPAVAPTALMLTQETPRENYLVQYAVSLEPDVTVPKVAPPSIGAPIVAPDTKLLKLAPDQLALAYSDILKNGEESEFYPMFRATGDSLREGVGLEYKNQKRKDLPKTAELKFSSSLGNGPDLALGTNESGAIVAVDLNEIETVKPVEEGATVEATGAAKKLSGIDASTKGIKTTYLHQLLFYVPGVGSDDKIVLLGFSQSLISSSEVK